ncbi:MAG: arsenate reductase family protein [Pseudomonadota bacterium]
MAIVIHHNPDCGTSRNVLAVLEAAAEAGGEAPEVIRYLETGWTRPQLVALFAAADLTPRQALRVTKSPADQLGLTTPDVAAEILLEAMQAHPILVNRPIVCTRRGVRLCRPSEAVLDLLEVWPAGPFAKEDGSQIIDEAGRRIS